MPDRAKHSPKDESGERAPDQLHGTHFAIVPEWVLVEPSDVVKLYAILDRFAGKDGQLWPGQVVLAEKMECSDRHVRKLLARMREMGALEVVRRRFNGSTIYRLIKERPEQPFLTDRNGGSTLTGTGEPPNESQSERAKERESPLVSDLPFETFWQHYPRKTDKGGARKAWAKAIKKATIGTITAGAQRYAADPNLPEPQFIPHPSTWLNGERWNDGPLPPRTGRPRTADTAMADEPDYWEAP